MFGNEGGIPAADFSFRDTTPKLPAQPMDPAQAYSQEWDMANNRFRAAINSGFSEQDADQMYLAPTRNKFEVLKAVPDPMKAQAAKELDDAHISFLKGIQSGYHAADAGNMFMAPVLQKWASSGQVEVADPAENYKQGALDMVAQGLNPQDVINANEKNIFSDPKFVAKFRQVATQAQHLKQQHEFTASERKAKETAAEERRNAPEALIRKMKWLADASKDPNMASAPPEVLDAIKAEAKKLAAKLSANTGPVQFQPTMEDTAAEHPSWTPAQVEMAKQGRMRGAQPTLKIFTDDSGKRFIYKGTATDPKSDKDPANWEIQQ